MTSNIDSATSLVTKLSFIHVSQNDWRRGARVDVLYRDYKPFGELKVPTRQARMFNGQMAWELLIDSVAYNVGLPASDFAGRQ